MPPVNAVNAVPVAVHGFTWTAALVALLNVLCGGALVAWIRNRGSWRKTDNEREANLLTERANEMKGMRETIAKLEARLDAKEIQHEAERAYDRHRINNLATSLNSFLMLVKRNPREAAAAAADIEELRARQIEEENKEAIALRVLIADLTVEKKAKEQGQAA